ncbi:MAG: IgGFc-binding protein [Deltaproteobacteria bacterium]|nr:IgGFc-binding protein [Deltaproteobacteria bacterium]
MRVLILAVALLPAVTTSCARPKIGDPEPEDAGGPDAFEFWYCELGEERCWSNRHQTCVQDGEFLNFVEEDCGEEGKICLDQLWCVVCDPGQIRCNEDATAIEECKEDGSAWEVIEECDVAAGEICYDGVCLDACDNAVELRSNVGCEYYAVDLDNASITIGEDASAQQFGVVVSNPGRILVHVTVEINNAPPGETLDLEVIDEVDIFPGDLEVFDDLPRREVDGTPEGAYDYQGRTPGTHLSSNAFRFTADHPVIAYQYNPMDNAGVFSNDASLLLPTSALDGGYVVMSWPQTIADTNDPATDFNDHLRSFLTIVGTADQTRVSVIPATDVVAGDNLDELDSGDTLEVVLGPFDVLNLETGGFNADFTGTVIEADEKVVVFSGSEASDVPYFESLAERLCCADHLEEQLTPTRTLGHGFYAARMPRRTPAVNAAGATVAVVEEPEWFRVMAVDTGITSVEVTLPGYEGRVLSIDQYDFIDLEAEQDFALTSDKRVSLGQFVASQQVVGIPNNLPGGDPAFITVPPTEQFRKSYVFLTPDLYAFDFMVIVAPYGATLSYDGNNSLPPSCEASPSDGLEHTAADPPDYVTYRCQLSFPELEPPPGGIGPWTVLAGEQDDGVHTLRASDPVGLLLYGFDSFVSYGLAGGTDLKQIQ